ncbi:signal recognition particle protein [Tropheryma whipplei]|uniref:signal recognition particle protein n=1 Tax=Tropheryma whipplei TaxID=2039 RepID=UPI001F4CC1C9|nr:signal recognition particle receptor subunit alpha [Tropheryma whipplei]
MFETVSGRFLNALSTLRGRGSLVKRDIDVVLSEVYKTLLDSDVSFEIAQAFVHRVRDRSMSQESLRAINPHKRVTQIVWEELVDLLGHQKTVLQFSRTFPTIIMLVGLQGSGKTSFAGKLAKWLMERGHTAALGACDLQRPAAASQLQAVAEQAGASVLTPKSGNVLDAVKTVVKTAREKQFSVLIIDTAGRMNADSDMMNQLSEIDRLAKPHQTLLVVDSATGQEALNITRVFCQHLSVTGVVMSKLDSDVKAGAALSVSSLRPIIFSCIGEGVDDLEQFNPDSAARRMLGMQSPLEELDDVLRLSDKTPDSHSPITLEDFLDSIQKIKNMRHKLSAFFPNSGDLESMLDSSETIRMQAIVRSMTPQERAQPRMLNASRRLRIATGSGTTVNDINRLIQKFEYVSKVLSSGNSMKHMTFMNGRFPAFGMRRNNSKTAKSKRRKHR